MARRRRPALVHGTSWAALLTLVVVATAAWADGGGPSERLLRLVRAIPTPGSYATFADLGISVGPTERPPAPIPGGYNFRYPADLDRGRVDRPPHQGRYPGEHLNLPLHVHPSWVSYAFLSDQPEDVRDNLRREDGTQGASGVYARADFPAGAPVRLMLDHTDSTPRPLRLRLLWLPRRDGVLMVRKRGGFTHVDSVLAGRKAFQQAMETWVEPNAALTAGRAAALFDLRLLPKQTAVAQMELVSTTPGTLYAAITEDAAPLPVTRAALDALPLMHSIRWSEQAQRLEKFIDRKMQPTRFRRILGSFQHARGAFHHPDRFAYAVYRVPTWSDAGWPVRVYSLYESIPGRDPTIPGPAGDVDNRGKYGADVGLRIRVRALPPGCTAMALLALNPDGTFGGRHHVTNHRNAAAETATLYGIAQGLLNNSRAALLWRGPVRPGDVLDVWTEPAANVSVYLWYLLVPLPPR